MKDQQNISDLLASVGRDINETGGFNLEIQPERSQDDLFNNRPGPKLREKILNLPDSPGVYMYL
ncbi:MAG: hypothetical protein K2J03_01645, partial [Muribaculaceae bacterium]|nr:hypothetical protein [Muribaculaceae bacterium]